NAEGASRGRRWTISTLQHGRKELEHLFRQFVEARSAAEAGQLDTRRLAQVVGELFFELTGRFGAVKDRSDFAIEQQGPRIEIRSAHQRPEAINRQRLAVQRAALVFVNLDPALQQ